MTQSIRNTRRTINGIGNGVRAVLKKPRSLSMAYYRNRETNTELLKLPEDGLGSDNTQKESILGAVFTNLGDSSSLIEREKSVLERSFFKKEKPEEVVSESENNSPAPIV